jgi:hypothetical protein
MQQGLLILLIHEENLGKDSWADAKYVSKILIISNIKRYFTTYTKLHLWYQMVIAMKRIKYVYSHPTETDCCGEVLLDRCWGIEMASERGAEVPVVELTSLREWWMSGSDIFLLRNFCPFPLCESNTEMLVFLCRLLFTRCKLRENLQFNLFLPSNRN